MKTFSKNFLIIIVTCLIAFMSFLIRRGASFEIDIANGYKLVNWGYPEVFISVNNNNQFPILISKIGKLNTYGNLIYGTCEGYAPVRAGFDLEEYDHEVYFLMKTNEVGSYHVTIYQQKDELLLAVNKEGVYLRDLELLRPSYCFNIISRFY